MQSRALVILTLAAGAVTAAPAAADVNPIQVRPLPNDRSAVVVGWRPRAGTSIVALRSGHLLVIHSLRPIRIGTRVRVLGIKWGTPTLGVRWSIAPLGIKWGIKWALNGTYSSNMLRTGVARGTAVRGTVLRRYRNAVAIGLRGGVIVVRVAVWLPGGGGIKTSAELRRPAVGDTILTRVRFGRHGRLIGRGVQVVRPAGVDPQIPVSGRISVIDLIARTAVVANVPDPAFPVRLTLRIPTTMDISRLRVGDEVASLAVLQSQDGVLRARLIAPNQSFEAGNDPASILVAKPPVAPAVIDLITQARNRWKLGRTEGGIPNGELYGRNLARLNHVMAAALDGDVAAARAELKRFTEDVSAAGPAKVDPRVAADVLTLAAAIDAGLPA